MTAATPIIDEDVEQALKESPSALAAFEALPPSHKREYLVWIGEAKKADTRVRRIGGMINRLTRPATDVQA